jgi:hypothetical protein
MLLPVNALLSYLVLPCQDTRTAAKNFDANLCSRMNKRSVREYIMSAYAQLLRNWRQQRPSNKVTLTRVSRGWLGESIA